MNELVEYVRRGKYGRVGVILSFKDDIGNIRFGWSLCRVKEDRFDKEEAMAKARERANGEVGDIPESILGQVYEFRKRSFNYFQDAVDIFPMPLVADLPVQPKKERKAVVRGHKPLADWMNECKGRGLVKCGCEMLPV